MNARRILFIVNVDWFFLSHRLAIARAARDNGAEVIVAGGVTDKARVIRDEGFGFLPLPISRKGISPLAELRLIRSILNACRQTMPDLIHNVTIKPVIYGSLASRLESRCPVINAVTGLGYSFSSGRHAHMVRPIVKALYRLALKARGTCTVFQNPDDREDFIRMGLVRREQTVIIRGSGVDCMRFSPTPEAGGDPLVVLAGRMLRDKGVEVFVNAARLVRTGRPEARFVLVGGIDPENRAAIPASTLDTWTAEGAVEWWGNRSDMPHVLNRAQVVVLPSTHREGLPKVLLEAAACARPLVATDLPGCREIVRHEVNGFLVPPCNAPALAAAISKLLESPALRKQFGSAGRTMVENEFSEETVVGNTLALYSRMLGGDWPSGRAAIR